MSRSVCVSVTRHALQRWRKRAAEYADARWSDLVDAWHGARHLDKSEPLPFPRRAKTEYRLHCSGAYLVAEVLSASAVRLVTVVVPGFSNPMVAKRKRKSAIS